MYVEWTNKWTPFVVLYDLVHMISISVSWSTSESEPHIPSVQDNVKIKYNIFENI
jgi:hypothetical protein